MDDIEIFEIAIKLYDRRKNGWFISGYKCPFCGKHYHTLRREMYTHIRNCDLEDVVKHEDIDDAST